MFKEETKECQVGYTSSYERPNFRIQDFDKVEETRLFDNRQQCDMYAISMKDSAIKDHIQLLVKACEKFYAENPALATPDSAKCIDRALLGLDHLCKFNNVPSKEEYDQVLAIVKKMEPILTGCLPPENMGVYPYFLTALSRLMAFVKTELKK